MVDINLPPTLGKTVHDFIKCLKESYGNSLISVMLYGSSVRGQFAKSHSNVNLLIILSDAGIEKLFQARGILHSRKFAALKPVFFDESYISASTDVFPIEFLDMKENYSVLYGKDALRALAIDTKNLRFQCEQELKSKLINLKGFYLSGYDKGLLIRTLFKSATSILHILKNIARLKGKFQVNSNDDVLKIVSSELGVDVSILADVLKAKNSGLKLTLGQAEGYLLKLARCLEELSKKVDNV